MGGCSTAGRDGLGAGARCRVGGARLGRALEGSRERVGSRVAATSCGENMRSATSPRRPRSRATVVINTGAAAPPPGDESDRAASGCIAPTASRSCAGRPRICSCHTGCRCVTAPRRPARAGWRCFARPTAGRTVRSPGCRLCWLGAGTRVGCGARNDDVDGAGSLCVWRAGLDVWAEGCGDGSGAGSGSAGNVTAGGSTGGGVGSSARALEAKSAPPTSMSDSASPPRRATRPASNVGPVLLGGVSMTGPLRRCQPGLRSRASLGATTG